MALFSVAKQQPLWKPLRPIPRPRLQGQNHQGPDSKAKATTEGFLYAVVYLWFRFLKHRFPNSLYLVSFSLAIRKTLGHIMHKLTSNGFVTSFMVNDCCIVCHPKLLSIVAQNHICLCKQYFGLHAWYASKYCLHKHDYVILGHHRQLIRVNCIHTRIGTRKNFDTTPIRK